MTQQKIRTYIYKSHRQDEAALMYVVYMIYGGMYETEEEYWEEIKKTYMREIDMA